MDKLKLYDDLVISGQKIGYHCPSEIRTDEDQFFPAFRNTTENILLGKLPSWYHTIRWDICEVSWVGNPEYHWYLRAKSDANGRIGLLVGLSIEMPVLTTEVKFYLNPPPPHKTISSIFEALFDKTGEEITPYDWVNETMGLYDRMEKIGLLANIRPLIFSAQADVGYRLYILKGAREHEKFQFDLTREELRDRVEGMIKEP